ncbi:hypothetical protein [Chitinophaga rhizosphaerae]|uniref:hypothetical protein n=1 Tax=Chitinophaga rhizosphaerae TaxID=1864947 RepID=UPI000F8007B1|nr:hypothetical protein [Chitinophaga rhizosphaerae]
MRIPFHSPIQLVIKLSILFLLACKKEPANPQSPPEPHLEITWLGRADKGIVSIFGTSEYGPDSLETCGFVWGPLPTTDYYQDSLILSPYEPLVGYLKTGPFLEKYFFTFVQMKSGLRRYSMARKLEGMMY